MVADMLTSQVHPIFSCRQLLDGSVGSALSLKSQAYPFRKGVWVMNDLMGLYMSFFYALNVI
jgi:hypothetical protein